MPYNLLVQGAFDLANSGQVLRLLKVQRDPLSGAVDGANKLFHTTYAPCWSGGSTAVYVGALATSAYVFAHDTGLVTFTSPPNAQTYADYTQTNLTQEQLLRVLLGGFDEMERRLTRGFRLTSSLSTYTLPGITDATIYVVDEATLADPLSGDKAWSASRLQVGFYAKCCAYVYAQQKGWLEAETAVSYREAGGTAVNVNRASGLERFLARLDAELAATARAASEAWGGLDSQYGAAVGRQYSADYLHHFRWQDRAPSNPDAYPSRGIP